MQNPANTNDFVLDADTDTEGKGFPVAKTIGLVAILGGLTYGIRRGLKARKAKKNLDDIEVPTDAEFTVKPDSTSADVQGLLVKILNGQKTIKDELADQANAIGDLGDRVNAVETAEAQA